MKIEKVNDSVIRIADIGREESLEISELYRYKVHNYQTMRKNPKFKNWNGDINLFDKRNNTLDYGHWLHFYETMVKRGYDVNIDNRLFPEQKFKDKEELETIIENFVKPMSDGEQITPYDYQIDALYHALETDRSVILSATSSGKSLIIYCLTWFYDNVILKDDDSYILVIVPDKGLVEQMYSDFSEYSNGDYENITQKINSDYSKILNKRVIVSTFQSAHKMPDLIENAGCIIVDEVHRAKSKQIKDILQSAHNCKYKHGLTGTLDGVEANEMLIQGLFGSVVKFVTQRELIDAGRACEVKVNIIGFRYSSELIKQYDEEWEEWKINFPHSNKYQFEIDFINNCKPRNDMLLNLISYVDGNTFVLFDRKDSHGIKLYEQYKEDFDNTYLITGDIKDRKDILDEFKEKSKATLFATSSIMSTGISVKNLHNLFFASSKKAKIATIQSIGRLMRLHDSKDIAYVYDIVDVIGKDNITQKHIDERIKHYDDEQIKYEMTIIDIE